VSGAATLHEFEAPPREDDGGDGDGDGDGPLTSPFSFVAHPRAH
jgi:hypothetical protein